MVNRWTGAAWVAGLLLASTALAQTTQPFADAMEDGVGVVEQLGAQVPLDLTFMDERGETVSLGKFFESGRPVILQIGYYECPMLCGKVSRGLLLAAKAVDLKMGRDYTAISVSFDPSETHRLAAAKKANYINELGQPDAAAGWHWLVGKEENIRRLTEAVGFHYKWMDSANQYSHAAVLMVLMPDGKVSRYLYGVTYPPTTFRLSLVEASAGRTGSTMDKILLTCLLSYDHNAGRYVVAARTFMQIGAGITIVLMGFTAWRLFRRERQKARVEARRPAIP